MRRWFLLISVAIAFVVSAASAEDGVGVTGNLYRGWPELSQLTPIGE
jgi:hypothetical protein